MSESNSFIFTGYAKTISFFLVFNLIQARLFLPVDPKSMITWQLPKKDSLLHLLFYNSSVASTLSMM